MLANHVKVIKITIIMTLVIKTGTTC